MAICGKSCDGCDYRGSISSGGQGARRTCDYILITGRRRGCPAGSGCTRKRVGGVVVMGIAADIREDVRAAKARKPKSGCPSEAAKAAWARRLADPAYQIEQIRKWNAMDNNRLRHLIWNMHKWRKKRDAAHGEET